jgi:uncharacterized protein YraI
VSPLPRVMRLSRVHSWLEGEGAAVRARRVSVWLCAMIALVAVSGACVFYPAAVFAASGTVSQETPLYDSADPAAPAIALLPEGTIVSIDGPPVAGFYPVTAGDQSGWMRGETLQLEKDRSESDPAEEMAADAPRDEMDETVPVEASADLDPARSTTVEPATDPAVDIPGATGASASVPVDASALASVPTIADDIATVPTAVNGAAPADASAIPVAEVAPVGPASVIGEAPILAGPGPEYGFIATAPVGSTVEQTGHVISGYATVQYAEVTGWLALEHLGPPGTGVEETSPAETAPVEAPLVAPPPADAPLTETSPTKTTSSDTPLAEPVPSETPPADTTPAETAPIEAAPVDAPPAELAPVAAP